MKDPYQILGVSKTSTQDEIKNAYRNLAKKFHPDLNPGNKTAESKFKDAASAYEMIGTPEARTKFDRGETLEQQQEQAQRHARESQGDRGPFYHQTQQDGGRYSYSFGKDMGGEDFFENLFRSQGGGRGQNPFQTDRTNVPGEDHLYQMSVEFRDAILGAAREITLPTGKRLQVKIPPGVETGTKLRFKNQGGPGIGSAPAGDAYVELTVKPLEGFKRDGLAVETEVSISFIEALLGASIKVPTLDGSVLLTVPPKVDTGTRLRIKGKGVSTPKGSGDQIVTLKVVMPKKVDPELENAVRGWGDKFAYNPREEA